MSCRLKNASGGRHHRVIEKTVHHTRAQLRRISLGKAAELYIKTAQSSSLATEIYFREFQLFSFLSEFMTLKGSVLMATEMETLYSPNM